MKSILSKLTASELRELSDSINQAQKKTFGNPLSLRKQEQLMADIFKVPNWSTALGLTQKEVKEINDSPEVAYDKKVVFSYLMDQLFEIDEECYMTTPASTELAEKLISIFDTLRNDAIRKFNRFSEDSELESLTKIEKILIKDSFEFEIDELILKIRAHG